MSSLRLATRAPSVQLTPSPDNRWTALAEIERDEVVDRMLANLMTKYGIGTQDAREVLCTSAAKAARRIEGNKAKAEIR